MPRRRRAAEQRRRHREARRAQREGFVPAPRPEAIVQAEIDQAWWEHRHGDPCYVNCGLSQ